MTTAPVSSRFSLCAAIMAAVVALPARAAAQTNISASTETELRDAIFQASHDFADNGVMNGGAYTITLTADITLTKSLPMIRATVPGDGSVAITIDGNNKTIDANNTGRGDQEHHDHQRQGAGGK